MLILSTLKYKKLSNIDHDLAQFFINKLIRIKEVPQQRSFLQVHQVHKV